MSAAEWLEHLRGVRGLSEATVRSYRCDLQAWTDFLISCKSGEESATAEQARAFTARMSERRMAPATMNRRISALRGYYDWLGKRNPGQNNPFSDSRTLRKGRRLPGFLTHEEIESFIGLTAEDFAGLRDRVIFELLYSTGCRVGELCALNVQAGAARQLRVKGKGGKERLLFVGSKAAAALNDYLPLRREHCAPDPDSQNALILDLRGKRLTPRGVFYLVNRYAVRSGVLKKVTPHTFRHSFATHLVDEGAGVRTVQELLGHSSLSTTQIYTHTGIERIKQIYRHSHPHARRSE